MPKSLSGEERVARVCHRHSRGIPLSGDVVIVDGSAASAVAFPGKDPDWWNVVVEGDSFGFNAPEGRWSYGREPDGGEVIARMILGNTDDLPSGSIETVQRKDRDKYKTQVEGRVDGVSIWAEINVRAKWQSIDLDGGRYSLNIKTGEGLEAPRVAHLRLALLHWVQEEIARKREVTRPAPKKPRERLSVEEVQQRNTDRARMRRALKPTPEVLGAFELLVSILGSRLPEGVELEARDLSKYLGVGLKGQGKWVCRLHYKTKNKAIELPGVGRIPLESWDELSEVSEEILRANDDIFGGAQA